MGLRAGEVGNVIKPARSSSRQSAQSNAMAGALILVVILLAFPVLVGLGTAVIAAVLGESLHRDARVRNEASELLELNT